MNPQHCFRNQVFASILYTLPSSLLLSLLDIRLHAHLTWLQGIDCGLIGQQGFVLDILNHLLFVHTFV
jgi:hypothetical protein